MLTKTLMRSSTGDRPLCRRSCTGVAGSCGRISSANAGSDGSTTLELVLTVAGAACGGISGRRARATRASSGSTRTSSGLIGSSAFIPGMEAAMADDFAIRTGVPVEKRIRLAPRRVRAHNDRSSRADCRMPIALSMRRNETHEDKGRNCIPSIGERIELLRPRMGVRVRGTVFYSDQLQILVKWDDGRSESLRPGVDGFRIVDVP
jgi:hypothetical protein